MQIILMVFRHCENAYSDISDGLMGCCIVTDTNISFIISGKTITPLTPVVKTSKLFCTQTFLSFLFSHHTVQVLQFHDKYCRWKRRLAVYPGGGNNGFNADHQTSPEMWDISRMLLEIKKRPSYKSRRIKQKQYLLSTFCIYVMVHKHHTERCFRTLTGVSLLH